MTFKKEKVWKQKKVLEVIDRLSKNMHFWGFGVSEINASEVFSTNLKCTGFYSSTCKFRNKISHIFATKCPFGDVS
jgi:hypothetical protein